MRVASKPMPKGQPPTYVHTSLKFFPILIYVLHIKDIFKQYRGYSHAVPRVATTLYHTLPTHCWSALFGSYIIDDAEMGLQFVFDAFVMFGTQVY